MINTHRHYVAIYRNAAAVFAVLMVLLGAYLLTLGVAAGGWFLIGLGALYLVLLTLARCTSDGRRNAR